MQRYFINETQINNNIIIIDSSDSHHIKNVMRMKEGDEVLVCDTKNLYLCKILSILDSCKVEIIKKLDDNTELDINITIAHGKVRKEKEEETIKKLVALGTFEYIPVWMKKTALKKKNFQDKKVNDKRKQRINKIIKEASEQSQRMKLMNYHDLIEFDGLINKTNQYDLVLFADVHDSRKEDIKQLLKNNPKNILIIVGPEGGFSKEEVIKIKETKAKIISLGKRVLRSELAPVFITSVIAYEVEK